MASQVAPAYLMVIMLLLPLAAFLISRSAQVFMWWVSTCTRRAFGGSIYGLTFASGTLVNKKQWSEINKSMATLPNLAEGLSGSDWATDDIQQRYWVGADRDAGKARLRVRESCAWRKSNGINIILQSPQPHFHIIKQVFPHGILCWSKSGYPVFAMRLGPLKNEFSRLAAAGVGNDELVSHVAFVYEWCWQKLDASLSPKGRFVNILDMEGLTIWDLQSKCMGVAKVTSKLSEFHYPDRLHRALMINAPGSINHMWGVVKPLLDKNAQERTSVFTTPHTYKGLLEELNDEDIPKMWGGSRTRNFYDGPEERSCFQLVAKLNGVTPKELAIPGMYTPVLP